MSASDRGPAPKGARRAASAAGLTSLVVIAVGASFVAIRFGNQTGFPPLLRTALFVATGSLVLLVLLSLIQLATQRKMTLWRKERPDAEIFNTVVNAPLRELISQVVPQRARTIPPYLPVIADSQGVELWGSGGYPGMMLRFDWAEVESILGARIADPPRNLNGILIAATINGQQAKLPLVLVGRGPGGGWNETAKRVEAMSLRLEAMKEQARPGSGL